MLTKNATNPFQGKLHAHEDGNAHDYVVRVGETSHDVSLILNQTGAEASLSAADGTMQQVIIESAWCPGNRMLRAKVDGAPVAMQICRTVSGWDIQYRGAHHLVAVRSPRAAELAALMPEKVAPDTSKYLLCPMPGLVVSIAVSEGQDVKAGETLAVVEAMKMENVLRAEREMPRLKKLSLSPDKVWLSMK